MGKITLLEHCEKTTHEGGKPRMRKITFLEHYEKTTHVRSRLRIGKITFCSLEDLFECKIR